MITNLCTADGVYLEMIYGYAGPNQLPFTNKDMYISSIRFLEYANGLSPDVAELIIMFGTDEQAKRLYHSLNKSIIKKLLRDGPPPDETAFLMAVEYDRIDLAKLYIKDGRVDINAMNGMALAHACLRGNQQMFNLLVKNGVEVFGHAPLYNAVKINHVKMVRKLLPVTKSTIKCFNLAISLEHDEIVEMFLAQKKYKKLSAQTIRTALETENERIIIPMARLIAAEMPKFRVPFGLKISGKVANAINDEMEVLGKMWRLTNLILDCLYTAETCDIAYNINVESAYDVFSVCICLHPPAIADYLESTFDIWCNAYNMGGFYNARALNAISTVIAKHRSAVNPALIRSVFTQAICMLQESDVRECIVNLQPIVQITDYDNILTHKADMRAVAYCIDNFGVYGLSGRFYDRIRDVWTETKSMVTLEVIRLIYERRRDIGWINDAVSLCL